MIALKTVGFKLLSTVAAVSLLKGKISNYPSVTIFTEIIEMALLEEYLEVKESIIPNSGKGLFSKIFIPKGTIIVEYKGSRKIWKEVEDDYKNGYIYFINDGCVVDAKTYKKALGRYANDAHGLSRIKGIKNNSVYVVDGKKVFIKAVKDIHAGSEILVNYGKEYWEITKKNLLH